VWIKSSLSLCIIGTIGQKNHLIMSVWRHGHHEISWYTHQMFDTTARNNTWSTTQ